MASNTARFFDEDFDALESGRNATLFLAAAAAGNASEVARLLPISWPDFADRDGLTPLMVAAGNGHANCVSAMLEWRAAHHAEHGAEAKMDVNHADNEGMTALMHAASRGDTACARLLIDKTDVNARDLAGDTALMHAIRRNPTAPYAMTPIDALLPMTDTAIRNDLGEDALFLSAKYNSPNVFAAVLSRSDPTGSYSSNYESILHVAADEYSGRRLGDGEQAAKIAILLADPRVEPNRANELGDTALHAACDFDGGDRVQALMAKVDPSIANRKGRTALMVAAKRGRADLVTALIPSGDPLAQDKGGMTALMHAAAKGEAACVDALAPQSNVNHADRFGNSAVHIAAARADHQVLSALLRMPGVNVDAVDQEGRSALFHAIAARHGQSVELLLSAPGSNPTRQDHKGQTALHVAAEGLNQAIVDALIDKVDPRVVDHLGRTAADMAALPPAFFRASKTQDEIARKLSGAAHSLDERDAIAGASLAKSAQAKPKSHSL